MTSSMTAFSRREHQDGQGELICELRSVNHRYLELSLRLPEELRSLEPLIRERINKRLRRGKVDCSFRFKPSSEAAAAIVVNERFARQLIDASGQVGLLLHEYVPPRVMEILRWPGVLEVEEQDMTPIQQQSAQLLEEAIDGLIESRQREGQRLAELISQRIIAMRSEVLKARELMPQVLENVKERLRARLAEVSDELDSGRLEQELALLAQRLDVDEEMDRLQTHMDEVDAVLKRDEPVGRRLDFLMQELNREANTLASKSNHVESTRIAVELKVLIEQMREQVQNIE